MLPAFKRHVQQWSITSKYFEIVIAKIKYFWSAMKGVPVIHDAYAQASIKLTRYDINP